MDGWTGDGKGSPTRLGKSLLHRGKKTERKEGKRKAENERVANEASSLSLLSILVRPTNRATDLTGLCVCKSSIPRGISLFERSVGFLNVIGLCTKDPRATTRKHGNRPETRLGPVYYLRTRTGDPLPLQTLRAVGDDEDEV